MKNRTGRIHAELRRVADGILTGQPGAGLPMHIATAALPLDRRLQDELHGWYASLAQADAEIPYCIDAQAVSLSANLQRVTWHVSGSPAPFSHALKRCLKHYELRYENLADLDEAIRAVQPVQLGAWICAQPQTFEVGWYMRPLENRLDLACAALPASSDLDRLLERAERAGVRECMRIGRSFVTDDELTEVYLRVSAPAPAQVLEAGLRLFEIFEQPLPGDAVESVLQLHQHNELFAALWLGRGGLAKLGLMLPGPSTGMVLRMLDVVGQEHARELAVFEGMLGVSGPAYLEFQRLAEGQGAELHYIVPASPTSSA